MSLGSAFSVFDWIDDRVLQSRHAFTIPAYCANCERVTKMQIDWRLVGGGNFTTSVNPAWTEIAACEICGLNSRTRAFVHFLKTRTELNKVRKAYIAEQITPLYQHLRMMFPFLTGSEFMGNQYKSGDTVIKWNSLSRVLHQDLTALSFGDGEFDLVMTLDVFEHIPDYRKVLAEMYRILVPGGRLIFTIPFFYDLEITRIRASIGPEGVIHHLPAEIHGNPVSKEGSLCFQNFGWDILTDLRKVGFSDALASMYWGPWQGHLGFPFFVFCAIK